MTTTTIAPQTALAKADAKEAGRSLVPCGPGSEQDAFRRLDRRVHARLGAATGGLSMIGLAEAWLDWSAHLAISPGKQYELIWKAWRKWGRLGASIQAGAGEETQPDACIDPLPQDRRFAAPEWQRLPFSLMYQSFLLTQQWWHNATTDVPGVETKNARIVEFYSRQFLDMLSPSNFLATNPQLIDQTLREGGKNLIRGATYWQEDVAKLLSGEAKADIRFTPGKEVARTPGKVVFRNRLIELIQYAPTTPAVNAVPIVVVPAWIMKYYILDLSTENSFVRWLVDQGFTVFCISWKNPDEGDRDLGFDDYREMGVMAAIEAACAITAAPKVHALGYCLGGTLLSVAAAAMARDGDDRLASMTMLAAQVDFSEAGELTLFTGEHEIALIEDMMWDRGYLDQRRMAGAFNMLRSQDLIWSRLAREYLAGERTDPNDLASWSADATRMPYRMHSEYLRRLFLGNDLSEGRFNAGGDPVYLSDIRAPVFAVATEADHIAPWHSVFKLTHLLPGDVDFALVSGGHNTGIVAAPGNARARYRRLSHRVGMLHPSPTAWAEAVEPQQGSWWEAWRDWLRGLSADTASPPPMGSAEAGYPPLGAAPGKYVLLR